MAAATAMAAAGTRAAGAMGWAVEVETLVVALAGREWVVRGAGAWVGGAAGDRDGELPMAKS